MKKRNFLIGILLVLAMIFIPNEIAYADHPLGLKCNSVATNGEIIECELRYEASSNYKIKAIKGQLTLSSTFTIDHVEFHELYDNSSLNKNGLTFQATSNAGVPTSNALLLIYVKANVKDNTKESDQVALTITTLDGSMGNIETGKSYTVTSNPIKLEIKNENRLSSLKVSDGTLSPAFDSDVLNYSLVTDKEEITITATPKDSLATVEVKPSKKVSLEYGNNDVEIVVTSQDNTIKTYKIIVSRMDNRNDNTKLQLLSVDGKKVSLKSNSLNYTVDVPYKTTEANLLYAAASDMATVDVIGSETLNVGENNIIIMVTSEKGTTEKYYLTINRLEEIKSDDSSIKKLEILNVDNLNFNFKPNNHNYIIKLPKKIDKLNLNIELNNDKATYNVTGNENLKNYSKILIKVTAEDESTTTYSILIEKKESNNLVLILIILIILLIGIVVGTIFIIKKKKNNNSSKYNNSNSNKNDGRIVLGTLANDEEKKDENTIIFSDKDDDSITPPNDSSIEEEKENVIIFTDPDEEMEKTKIFVIDKDDDSDIEKTS